VPKADLGIRQSRVTKTSGVLLSSPLLYRGTTAAPDTLRCPAQEGLDPQFKTVVQFCCWPDGHRATPPEMRPMTTTNANATHALLTSKNGQPFTTVSFHGSAKEAAKAGMVWLGRGLTAKVVAL